MRSRGSKVTVQKRAYGKNASRVLSSILHYSLYIDIFVCDFEDGCDNGDAAEDGVVNVRHSIFQNGLALPVELRHAELDRFSTGTVGFLLNPVQQ